MKNKTTWFDWSFMGLGLLVQVVTYCITSVDLSSLRSPALLPEALSPLSLVSGCLGVCAVCLTAQGNILTYAFGFAQVITYTWLCLRAHLYGAVAINVYYFLTMIYGVYVWRRRLRPEDGRVRTRTLPRKLWLSIVAAVLLLSVGVGMLLQHYTSDPSPYLDSFTTVVSIVAQILMILAFRDQWFLWLAVDVLSVAIWLHVGDYCLMAQYVFWCLNCLYGYFRWRSLGISNE